MTMTDNIKSLANANVTQIKLAEPIKLGGKYIAHASIDARPIIYMDGTMKIAQVTEDAISFDLTESSRVLVSSIVDIDKQLVDTVSENAHLFFGKPIRAETIEAAYSSNAQDGLWTFKREPELIVKDQYGTSLTFDDETLTTGPVKVFVELVGVSIGKVTMRPAWKLHKIQVYKKTVLPDDVSEQEPENVVPPIQTETTHFYDDADEH